MQSKDAYISDKNGDCWLVLDRRDAAYTTLDKSCPRTDNQRFTANMIGGIWRLTCASELGAYGGNSKSAPGSGTLDKLPDIKPF